MKLYLLRHGEASWSGDDISRPLTDRGKQDIYTQVVSNQSRLNPDVIWVSEYRRAQESAAIAADSLSIPVRTFPELSPDASPADFYALLNKQGKGENILIVSHNPVLTILIKEFCGEPQNFIGMDTASLVAIKYEFPAASLGELLWISHVSEMTRVG